MNILFTSVGRRTYMVRYFKKALGGKGKVYAANSSGVSPAFLEADECVVTPTIYEKEYIPFLLKYCKEKNIAAIVSLFDVDLPILSEHKQEFLKIGTNVIVAEPEFVEICNDKWKTFLFLRENRFQVPQTFLHIQEVKEAIQNHSFTYPVMVKPRWGMGSIAVYQADDEQELEVFYKKIKKAILKSYLKYESAQNMEECVLIQEKINGQEYGLDVMNDLQGMYQNTSVKKKVAMRSGETDCAITVDEPYLKQIGEKIAGLSHHVGNLDVDIFKGTDGQCYVLEMNARFGGGYPFSHLAGVNLPLAIINWMEGKTVPVEVLTPRIGVLGQKDIELVQLPKEVLK